MPQTIYGSFPNYTQCEQAAGALLDYGVRKEDLSVVANESWHPDRRTTEFGDSVDTVHTLGDHTLSSTDSIGNRLAAEGDRTAGAVTGILGASTASARYNEAASERADAGSAFGNAATVTGGLPYESGIAGTGTPGSTASNVAYVNEQNRATAQQGEFRDEHSDIEGSAKQGISVTTPGDAASGAAKGAGWGVGLGVLAAIASLAVPGFGLVLGGGALATAIAGALGTTVAGAAAGSVVGYLKDQGVPDEVASHYDTTIREGGAMLAVVTPSNNVDSVAAEQILRKYGATNVNAY